MGLRSLFVFASLLSAFAFVGCSKDSQKILPETRGKRGENCQARNDCEKGLACLGGICAKNEFNIDVKAMHCDRIECDVDKDCCGSRKTKAPDKCKDRELVCNPENATLLDCVRTTCVTDGCGDGSCPMGTCSRSADSCETASDCPQNTCEVPAAGELGTCSLSGASCYTVADCLQSTCSTRICDCVNPDYDPEADICSDPDCDDICLLRCEDERCVQDQSCKTDSECLAAGKTTCDGGRCVDCTSDDDCDTKNDETCESGLCHKPCSQNEECGLFEECKKGDCVYAGCKDDRECILAASRGTVESGTPDTAQAISGTDDPRLYKCLPSEEDPDIKTCKIPCENDGSCGQFQVCDKGYCKFVGCDNNEQCRVYLGIANQMTSDAKPYVATAVCRE